MKNSPDTSPSRRFISSQHGSSKPRWPALKTRLLGPEDALFPKPERALINSKFSFATVSRSHYANADKLNQITCRAFANVQLPQYTAHGFRHTLALLRSDLNLSVEQQKAWSQNLGHDNLQTTVSHYMKVSEQRQVEQMGGLGKK